jgi:molecular chaperone DnaK
MKIGIDLGTTNTAAAFLDNGEPRLIPNSRGHVTTPSVVGVDSKNRRIVGESARNQLRSVPERTVGGFKRFMGKRTTIPVGDSSFSPEEISAFLLEDVRRYAETYLGESVTDGVVTVPAHFDDRRRAATMEAALLAGFHHVSLLNEPTAAALPYAVHGPDQHRIVVFDFGGGTLDVTCLERKGREYVVQATRGDGELGGMDIDILLFRTLLDRIGRSEEEVLHDPYLYQLMYQISEQTKVELSDRDSATVTIPFVHNVGSRSHTVFDITRSELEEVMEPLMVRARELTAGAVSDAGFLRSGFDTLILSGGSSRIPAIRRFLRDDYGVTPLERVNPEEVVARGAAMYTDLGTSGQLRLRDGLSGSLSIELSDGSCVPVIRKNQSIPATRTRIFTTVSDGQFEAEVHLLQGDNSRASENRSLGKFTLRNIEKAPQGKARIAVTVSVDSDGLVTVKAGDRTTGVTRQITTRNRTESIRQKVEGETSAYLGALVRRVQGLARFAEGELRLELEDMVALMRESGSDAGDDMLTVLEALIAEVVSEQNSVEVPGAGRAAS